MFAVAISGGEPNDRGEFAAAQVAKERADVFDVAEFAIVFNVGE